MGYRYLNTGTAVPVFAAEPPVATEGSLYFNSTSDIFYICNGTKWNLVSNASPATTGGTRTIDALSEGGTFSYDLGDDFTDDVDTDAELTYALVSGTLPTGCTLPTAGNSEFTGTASGVSSNTNYTWTIKATDTSGGTATQDYQQTITTVTPTVTGGTVAISATSEGASASYDVDTDFSYPTGSTFSAYSLVSGTLPSGTSLNTSTGVISGTAGNSGSYSFTIRATDTDGDTADQAYTWVTNNVVPTSTGGTVTISAVKEGYAASYDVDTNFTFTTGSAFSAYSLASGTLPSGLSLNASTGVISGTMGSVSSETAYSFSIRGTDTNGDTVDQSYSWTILDLLSATGGTITTYSSGGINYKVNTFTSSGTITFNKSGTVDVLVVAGGGGGGIDFGGAGGAGGFRAVAGISVTASAYTVTVGAGGVGATISVSTQASGNNSVFNSITSVGGGHGSSGSGPGSSQPAESGGSGGGGGGYNVSANPAGSGTSGQGNAGGVGFGASSNLLSCGGGGGGAGAVGQAAVSSNSGDGGNGSTNNYRTGSNITYAGGGGGGYHVTGTVGAGGSGGGGGGGSLSPVVNGTSGTVNTGGGGGGSYSIGGNGGSGIVIIRYAV